MTTSPTFRRASRPALNPSFDIVATYHHLLRNDPDLTMPVAAIESLIMALNATPSTTVSETLDLVSHLTTTLKLAVNNPISLGAGTDLFQQYLITNLTRPASSPFPQDFDQVRAHLIQNGKLFVSRAKAARHTIASLGKHFVRDGHTILTNGGSRVVGALLKDAAENGSRPTSSSNALGAYASIPSQDEIAEKKSSTATTPIRGSTIRFRVIYVMSPSDMNAKESSESEANIAALRARGIPVATIPPTAIAYCMDSVTACFVGAEGVVENGGVVSRLGTYQMGMLAQAAGKPFYVVAESHKFVRLFPIGQHDLGLEQNIVNFKTGTGSGADALFKDEGVADVEDAEAKPMTDPSGAVDYTPPHLISGIITESGVLLPSAVSEELIKIWF